MTYKSKTQFTDKHKFRKASIVEYCLGLEKQGLNEKQIQAKMIVDNVSKSARAVGENFSFYKSVAKEIGWVK